MPSNPTRRGFLAGATALLVAGPSLARTGRAPTLAWTPLIGGRAHATDTALTTGGNCLAIPGQSGTMLIDAKFSWLGELLRDDARSLTGESARVALINTHHHADHTGGNWAFTDRHPVYAHVNAKPRIIAQHERYLNGVRGAVRSAQNSGLGEAVLEAGARTLENAAGLDAQRWAPTRTIEGLDTELPFDGMSVHASHFGPGHTDNDLVIHIPELNLVHTGDLVFNGLHPYCDQSAGVSIRGWIASLWRILERCDADTTVVPGHGEIAGRGIVRAQIDYFEQLLESVAAGIDRGETKGLLTGQTFGFMEGLGFEQIRPIAIGTAYDEIKGSL